MSKGPAGDIWTEAMTLWCNFLYSSTLTNSGGFKFVSLVVGWDAWPSWLTLWSTKCPPYGLCLGLWPWMYSNYEVFASFHVPKSTAYTLYTLCSWHVECSCASSGSPPIFHILNHCSHWISACHAAWNLRSGTYAWLHVMTLFPFLGSIAFIKSMPCPTPCNPRSCPFAWLHAMKLFAYLGSIAFFGTVTCPPP